MGRGLRSHYTLFLATLDGSRHDSSLSGSKFKICGWREEKFKKRWENSFCLKKYHR